MSDCCNENNYKDDFFKYSVFQRDPSDPEGPMRPRGTHATQRDPCDPKGPMVMECQLTNLVRTIIISNIKDYCSYLFVL